jgi:hypothetical protein
MKKFLAWYALAVALSEIYPALVMLVIGVVVCLVLNSNSSRR